MYIPLRLGLNVIFITNIIIVYNMIAHYSDAVRLGNKYIECKTYFMTEYIIIRDCYS